MKAVSLGILLTILCLLLFNSLVFLTYASGGSKVTTFHYNGGFGPTLFDADVHFSWDSDTWLLKENHEVGFTIEIKNIASDMVNLTLSVNKITVRLKSQDLYHGAMDVLSQDVSNQVTTLVWMQFGNQIINNLQSFSYAVNAPEPYNSVSQDESVELYYMIEIVGHYSFQGASSSGSGTILPPYLSNEGGIIGGVEDPVWITVEGVPPQFPLTYVVIGIVVVICASAITAGLVIRRNRSKKKTLTTSPSPPPPSSPQQPSAT